MPTTQASRRRRARRRAKAPRPPGQVYLSQVMPAASARRPGRARRRRNRRQTNTSGQNTTVRLSFVTDTLQGNSYGTIKLGPNCAQSEALKGLLKAFQKYRVTSLTARWNTEASSTDRGSMAYHIDTSVSASPTTMKSLTKWPLKSSGSATFGASVLGDASWVESTSDQVWFLYKGSGESQTAGTIVFGITVVFSNPK
nr:major coat protein [Green Sichuan pepper enamovirus]